MISCNWDIALMIHYSTPIFWRLRSYWFLFLGVIGKSAHTSRENERRMLKVSIEFIGVAMISCSWDLAMVIPYSTTIFGRLRSYWLLFQDSLVYLPTHEGKKNGGSRRWQPKRQLQWYSLYQPPSSNCGHNKKMETKKVWKNPSSLKNICGRKSSLLKLNQKGQQQITHLMGMSHENVPLTSASMVVARSVLVSYQLDW